MKKICITIFCAFFATAVFCQDTLTSYFDASWKETTADNFQFYRKKVKKENVWAVVDYYKSGKLQMKGSFLDDSCKKQQGEFLWYDETGSLSREDHFTDGKSDGRQAYYYPNGKAKMVGSNKMDKKDGEWTAYYESGKISGKAMYKNDKQISAIFFKEDGSPNNQISEFEKESEYPGGVAALSEFLSKHLRYPDKALKNNTQGTVVVQFIVDKDGSVTDVQVAKGVDPLLDEEAVRVIKKMPKWQPAIQGGRQVKSYKKQPIAFRF
ncbi:MAG TPA: TonB family protein [Puia sp.]|nr:TonB family protein [Puia sp.]